MKLRGTLATAPRSFQGWLIPPAVTRIFGDIRFRIDTPALALAFEPDGSAWSVEEEGVVRHWSAATGQELEQRQLSDLETVWAFSLDASQVAAGGAELSVWETGSGECRFAMTQPTWVSALAFRPDGRILATGHDNGNIRLWDAATGRLVREMVCPSKAISALAFTPDGSCLAAASEDRLIRLWSVPSGELRGELHGHTDRIDGLAWHPNGAILASAGWDSMARLWDATLCEPIILLNSHANVVSALTFSPDGRLLATADSDQIIRVWEVDTLQSPPEAQVLLRLSGHIGEVNSLVFDPEGQYLLSGGQDRRLLMWDVTTGQTKCGVVSAEAGRSRICLSPDGLSLACADGSSTVRILDAMTGARRRRLAHANNVLALAYSGDGLWLATGDATGAIYLWSADGEKLVRRFTWHRQAITSLAFAPSDSVLASGGGTDGYVYLWTPDSDEPVLLIPEATDGCTVETVSFCPNGRFVAAGGVDWLATGGSDGAVSLWDMNARKELATFSGGTARLAVRPDGKQLAAATLTDSILLWDLSTNRLAHEFVGHTAMVNSMAYSPDGSLLAAGDEDGMLLFWQTGVPGVASRLMDRFSSLVNPDVDSLAAQVNLHTPLCDLVFSHDGRWLYTANANSTCYVVDVRQLLDGD